MDIKRYAFRWVPLGERLQPGPWIALTDISARGGSAPRPAAAPACPVTTPPSDARSTTSFTDERPSMSRDEAEVGARGTNAERTGRRPLLRAAPMGPAKDRRRPRLEGIGHASPQPMIRTRTIGGPLPAPLTKRQAPSVGWDHSDPDGEPSLSRSSPRSGMQPIRTIADADRTDRQVGPEGAGTEQTPGPRRSRWRRALGRVPWGPVLTMAFARFAMVGSTSALLLAWSYGRALVRRPHILRRRRVSDGRDRSASIPSPSPHGPHGRAGSPVRRRFGNDDLNHWAVLPGAVAARPIPVATAATRREPLLGGAVEQLVPEDAPTAGQGPDRRPGRSATGPRRPRHGAGRPGRHGRRRPPAGREDGHGQMAAVAVGGPARRAEHGFGRRPPAGHGLGDALTLQGVDQPGGVAHQQHPSGRRGGPDHAHLEPSAQAAGQGQAGARSRRPSADQVVEIGRQQPHRARTGLPVGQRPDPEPDVGRPAGSRERSSRSRGTPAIGSVPTG